MITSYGKIYPMGHRHAKTIFDEPVSIQEKVDGSQFSFMRDGEGQIHFRSKNVAMYPGAPGSSLFSGAMEYLLAHQEAMLVGTVYRGEVLHARRHNVLTYDRVPKGNLVLFDARYATGGEASYGSLTDLAQALEVDVVPELFFGKIADPGQVEALLNRTSFLGGTKIEGVVIKNYHQKDPYSDSHLMAKLVSADFKEVNKASPMARVSQGTRIDGLIQKYATIARYRKAVQHLRDSGSLTESSSDIGPLMAEVARDLQEEEIDQIKEDLFKLFWKDLARGVTKNVPTWYKLELTRDV